MQLPKVVTKSNKRVGRGIGSGKGGHTSGRGQKGQRSRGKIGILFEGVKMKKSLIKRLPLSRGKGKFKSKNGPIVVNMEVLNIMPTGSIVNIESLVKAGIVDSKDAKKYGVKILGKGTLTKKLKIELPMSKSVAKRLAK
ncbi:MAG: 50S ribosomal protein L15 [Patescibacteria group bacterium]|mgnify:FL=1